ncbi:SDR family NAD(P)-dependent oxidoreductase [Bdellovibrio svalbardensis]|uniref:SDR family NAD(P)-dependent oxidoreductase n=1 Tax=Bdellovibrio svalbardensis TaxID=2972972 RepID=A0ABT6DKG5_9BACT|nr:SDR family NAD(P)-dependent oxidoreductase [Bdellovibrio svalbardensis]MDG0815598.1 SDR family NAD(P)-dependent oxidoreductase [Bdellovibrio svalbardensis]
MEITNRQVLVTGASRGIGRAFAKMCAQDKAFLHIVLRKNDETLVKELEEAGAKAVTVYEADLSSRESIDALLLKLKDTPIDILFNNAGVLTGGLIEEQPLDDIYKMFQVNINALVHLTHGILPGMISRKRGKIINNSSVSAYMNFPCASTYAASKAAVAAFTNCIQLELKDTNVTTLLLITPGIKTRMFDEIETLYGKNIQVPGESTISPGKYAQIIREAILHDLPVLEPSGLTGIGLKVAKFVKPLFDFEISRRFHRN